MNQVSSPVHSWYHALTLSERMASLGTAQSLLCWATRAAKASLGLL